MPELKMVYFFDRVGTVGHPAGMTISKQSKLPDGDFRITEYCWGAVSLWFIDADEFTADERQAAYEQSEPGDA